MYNLTKYAVNVYIKGEKQKEAAIKATSHVARPEIINHCHISILNNLVRNKSVFRSDFEQVFQLLYIKIIYHLLRQPYQGMSFYRQD